MIKLYAETHGKGRDIVLLHGWGIHSGIWQLILPKLAQEFRVTLIDLPGCGRSPMISNYSLSNIVKHLYELVPKQSTFIGWSLGGLIATQFALTYPEVISKLICVASTPKFVQEKSWPGMSLSLLEQFNKQLKIDYKRTLMRFLLLQFYGVALDKEMIHWLNINLHLHGQPSMEALDAGLSILKNEDLRQEIKKLSCPLLYILGKTDALVPHRIHESLKDLEGNIKSILFPKASHAIFLSHEKEFIDEVRRFIDE